MVNCFVSAIQCDQRSNRLIALFRFSVQQRNVQHQHQHSHQPQTTIIPNGTNAAQLHKLLVSGTTSNSSIVTTSSTISAPELARLPVAQIMAGSNGSTLYRGNGKLAIINNGITIKGRHWRLVNSTQIPINVETY